MTKRYAIFNADNALVTRLVSGVNDIPEGAIEVDDEIWLRITQETDGIWTLQADGSILKEPPPAMTLDALIGVERGWRNGELDRTQWLTVRHRDEQDMIKTTTLTTEQFAELLLYRQALRDWPQAPDFPNSRHRPTAPLWLPEQPQ